MLTVNASGFLAVITHRVHMLVCVSEGVIRCCVWKH